MENTRVSKISLHLVLFPSLSLTSICTSRKGTGRRTKNTNQACVFAPLPTFHYRQSKQAYNDAIRNGVSKGQARAHKDKQTHSNNSNSNNNNNNTINRMASA